MMWIRNVSDFRRAVRHGPYAWPGGYPCYFVTMDGAALSFRAAKECRREILSALARHSNEGGWLVVGMDVNWEDTALECDHTHEQIPSAYGESTS